MLSGERCSETLQRHDIKAVRRTHEARILGTFPYDSTDKSWPVLLKLTYTQHKTCPNFDEYCCRKSLLHLVQFCIAATPTLSGVPSLVVLPSEFPVRWPGILGTKPVLPSSHGTHLHTGQHSEVIKTERLLYFGIGWLEPLSIFGSSVFNRLPKKKEQFDDVSFSIAFRSFGSWQVDSTSWVC